MLAQSDTGIKGRWRQPAPGEDVACAIRSESEGRQRSRGEEDEGPEENMQPSRVKTLHFAHGWDWSRAGNR